MKSIKYKYHEFGNFILLEKRDWKRVVKFLAAHQLENRIIKKPKRKVKK